MTQVIYQYFKKELEEGKILVRINPQTFEGTELLVNAESQVQLTKRLFDKTIYEDLDFDEFSNGSALEFNLYLKGIGSQK